MPSYLLVERVPYTSLSWLCDVLVRFEEGSNVHRLATPEVSVDCPVQSKFERPSVE
jgi:hypothetical protein